MRSGRIAVLGIVLGFSCAADIGSAQDAPRRIGEHRRPYLAVGKLKRQVSNKTGKTRYALFDEENQLTSYAVPAEGVELEPYVGHRVELTARSVFFHDPDTAHLLVAKITPLTDLPINDAAEFEVQNFSVEAPLDTEPTAELYADDEVDAITEVVPTPPRPARRHTAGSKKPKRKSAPAAVRVASHEEPIAEDFPHIVHEEGAIAPTVGEEWVDAASPMQMPLTAPQGAGVPPGVALGPDMAGMGGPNCGLGCGPGCGAPGGSCGDCPCGPPGYWWFRGEYLLWWTDGMEVPPLVTTGPASNAGQAGVLGESGTQVLFGNESILEDNRHGGRFLLGTWLDQCQWLGIEADYLFLGDEDETFDRNSSGDPVLARPFNNIRDNSADAEIVAFPNVSSGRILVSADTELSSAGARFRSNICCQNDLAGCAPNAGLYNGHRVDFLIGYRFLQLNEGLGIREDLNATINNVGTTFVLDDRFDTENDFHGVDLGAVYSAYRGVWSVDLTGRVAVGNVNQQVTINGSTTTTTLGVPFTETGGLLALSSNIGRRERDEFAVVPELGATIGLAVTPRLRLNVGYTFLYLSRAVRPGEQIDLDVNDNLLPPARPNPGLQRPEFVFRDTDFWAQGVNFGLTYRW